MKRWGRWVVVYGDPATTCAVRSVHQTWGAADRAATLARRRGIGCTSVETAEVMSLVQAGVPYNVATERCGRTVRDACVEALSAH